MSNDLYSSEFYSAQKKGSLDSAMQVTPVVMKLVSPKSVVDLGCGIGTWLKAFSEQGVKEIRGIDGNWVKPENLVIPKDKFMPADLRKTLKLNKKYDLAISLEVGEHIAEKYSDPLVDSLTNLSDTILFSAAIPFQGGVDHINEQWQSYWAGKFEQRGYVTLDPIRSKFWNDKRVAFFYAQNMLLFVKKSKLKSNKKLQKIFNETNRNQLDIVHPERYLIVARERSMISKWIPPFLKKLRLNFLKNHSG